MALNECHLCGAMSRTCCEGQPGSDYEGYWYCQSCWSHWANADWHFVDGEWTICESEGSPLPATPDTMDPQLVLHDRKCRRPSCRLRKHMLLVVSFDFCCRGCEAGRAHSRDCEQRSAVLSISKLAVVGKCKSRSCGLQAHTKPYSEYTSAEDFHGYCCFRCLKGAGHGRLCENVRVEDQPHYIGDEALSVLDQDYKPWSLPEEMWLSHHDQNGKQGAMHVEIFDEADQHTEVPEFPFSGQLFEDLCLQNCVDKDTS